MGAKPSEKVAVVGTVDPDALAATTGDATDWVSMVDYQQVMFVVLVGNVVSSGKVDFLVQAAKDSTGGSVATLQSGTLNITQLDSTDDDSQVVVNVETEDLSEDFNFVRGVLALTNAGADAAVVALGLLPRFAPANDTDLASVAEIKG